MASDVKRIPPHSLDAEQAVLASLLIDDKAADKVLHMLTPGDFYSPIHQYIYSIIYKLHEGGKPVDIISLANYANDRNELPRAGGVEYISSLMEIIPNSANAEYYANIVKDKSTLRQLIGVAVEMTEDCYTRTDDVAEVVEAAEKKIFSLAEQKLKADILPIGEHMHRTFEVLEKLYHRKEDTTGIPSGFMDLDQMTNGFQRSDLIVIAGRPGMGKTAFTLNVALNSSKSVREGKDKFNVAFFSLEMSSQQLIQRLLSGEAGVNSNKLRSGKFSYDEWTRLTAAAGELSELGLFLDDTPAITAMELRAKCRRLKREHGIDLVIIDYLQLMGSHKTESREQQIADISRSLKALAKEMDIPIIALSQLNRGVESRIDKRPLISDLRESGAIEQDADIIVFLYRDDFYNKEKKTGITEVIIAKHRNGSTGTVNLEFVGEYMKFRDVVQGYV
ncbi:replicative DNA helicase [Geovibrio thiophilus]|uniref:Replicative DNA helicase n=1 Tax=Geovibrio thiophilus TaxID=139438 RepID=A0A3R5YXL6_9BACT|nr:replicative DNA helicase [Geovibrio thiophilus]QAR31949.1 replicative DNA helicase [Geovibrio thiophilus]